MRHAHAPAVLGILLSGCGDGSPGTRDAGLDAVAPGPDAPDAGLPDAAPGGMQRLACLDPGRAGACEAVAAGAGGSIYTTGWVDHPFTAANVWTRAFAADGAVLWSHERDSSEGSPDDGAAIAVDPAGEPVVGGHWYSHTDTAFDWLVFRPPPSGPVAWEVFGETIVGHDAVTGLAIDAAGSLAVVGYRPGDRWWVRRLAPDGAEVWSRSGDGLEARAVAIAGDGRTFVAGTAAGAGGAARLVAYAPGGGIAWSITHDGPGAGDDAAVDVAVGAGRVAVAGRQGDAAWVAVYTIDGDAVWSDAAPGGTWRGIAVDAAGGVVVTEPARTRRHAPDGAIVWTRPIGGSDVAIDTARRVVIAAGTEIVKLAP